MEKRVIPVLEMSCAVCAATVEKTVRELTGVEEASVNFSANTLQVVYDPDKISLKDMQAAVSTAVLMTEASMTVSTASLSEKIPE